MKNKVAIEPFIIAVCLISATIITQDKAMSQDTHQKATNKSEDNTTHKFTNRLSKSQSPYLLQHQHNPVDWYPWGEEAFAKATKLDKPIFLSVGYSTCHWCHVMEHESFEDEEVGRLMNDAFVCIKVDREERPDIDNIYMSVTQAMTGRGGWPMTVIMTPERKPFFAGTYFPKKNMIQMIQSIKNAWQKERDKINQKGDQIELYLLKNANFAKGDALDISNLKKCYTQLSSRFDKTHGGFSSSPKFPIPHNILFLLRHYKRTGDKHALAMVEKTLVEMRKGGLFDHLGFGFHRYSTDKRWFLPHFEKMLYDQALLACAYSEAYQVTSKLAYADTAKEIFTYVLRDMTDTKGGFYSAEDADSEGVEGKFYLWTQAEMKKILTAEETEVVFSVLSCEEMGNYYEEHSGEKLNTSHLHMKNDYAYYARALNISEEKLHTTLNKARTKLFNEREKRIHPYKDDKIMTDWNGLMIAALAKGARHLNAPQYLDAAKKCADFFLSTMVIENNVLLHRYRQGQAGIAATVEDYAFFVWGLIELYQSTFDIKYLRHAINLNNTFIDKFWDSKNGAFFYTAVDGEKLLSRPKEVYDGAIPSGNSIAMYNLIQLARLTGDTSLEQKATETGAAFATQINDRESGQTFLMSALSFVVGPSLEIVIVGDPKKPETTAMLKAVNQSYSPNKVVIFKDTTLKGSQLASLAPYTKLQVAIDGKATAYVCQNFACAAPTTDIKKMLTLMKQ